jgi:hypothetical protein
MPYRACPPSPAVRRLRWGWVWCSTTLVPMACGDGSNRPGESADDTGGISMSASQADASVTDTDPSASGDTAADGVDTGCSPELVCEDECCAAGEACVDGECVLDCGDSDPCGADPVCCEDGQICYVGNCVVPGSACKGLQCATNVESECEDGEICDNELGLCVPDFANPDCAFEPEVGQFEPIPRFTWGVRATRACAAGCQVEENCVNDVCTPTWTHVEIAADDYPEWHQVVMTPMVADLDGDCIPEIVFNSYQNSDYTTDGILRAIRGDTGAKVWSVGDAMYRTDPGSHPAIGDLDGDGRPEVVSPGQGSTLVAVAGDGSPLWISDPYTFGGKSGSPSLANFDGQGAPEIAYGRAVWDSAGTLLYEAPSGSTGASGSMGPIPCVADLNGDDLPELIAGDTAYTFTGTVGVDFAGAQLWTATPGDGWCGVADFDLDGMPEVALVSSGTIWVLDGQTGTSLASIGIPLGGAGGPPNIADFDGDGVPDIGTAANDRYVVAQFDGVATMSQLWVADTKDSSSERTGSSVFDFDGDGRNEVIYADEWYLRIYPGTEPDCAVAGPLCDGVMTDEEILFIDINSSRTRSENPVVADVDGDFKAEIVVSTNNESSQGAIGDAGIEVFEDRLDNWVATLPIWNQHAYHVTNVLPDGTIPTMEPPNWSEPAGMPHNSYRRNTQGALQSLCAPDLVPADFQFDEFLCPELDMSVKVLNQGCLGVGPGVNVAFYDDGTLLGVVQTENAIPAGGSETVSLMVDDATNPPYDITVVVDDDGMGMGAFNECDEENNASEPIEVCIPVG